ncbi:hypothetical protein MTP03_16970 [Tsukamurella sp. PLM1]|nr:hypothetical protein MTP03_16970 [Tsukamurella sp. PLM1]
MIWAGGGAARAGAALTEMVQRWGIPLLTSNSGRGAVDEDHELCIGNYANSPLGRELLADADLLISLGTHFRSNETGDYTMPVPAEHVQVDLDPRAIGRVYPATAGIVADTAATLRALLADPEAVPSVDAEWTARGRDTPRRAGPAARRPRPARRAAGRDRRGVPGRRRGRAGRDHRVQLLGEPSAPHP